MKLKSIKKSSSTVKSEFRTREHASGYGAKNEIQPVSLQGCISFLILWKEKGKHSILLRHFHKQKKNLGIVSSQSCLLELFQVVQITTFLWKQNWGLGFSCKFSSSPKGCLSPSPKMAVEGRGKGELYFTVWPLQTPKTIHTLYLILQARQIYKLLSIQTSVTANTFIGTGSVKS